MTSLIVTNPATGAWMKYSPTHYNDSWGYTGALLTGSDGSTKEITNLPRGLTIGSIDVQAIDIA
jgi:hypothetical protein